MGKFVNKTAITATKGVNAFERFCLNHNPAILWRETTHHDYGVDGQVEFTRFDENGKNVASGELIGIQLKSTSVISKQGKVKVRPDGNGITYYASKDDFEYWTTYTLPVVLVIYDEENDELYAKSVPKIANIKKAMVPIEFEKTSNSLGKDCDFRQRFAGSILSRHESKCNEVLSTNIFRFSRLPRFIFQYKLRENASIKEVCSKLNSRDIPPFVRWKDLLIFFFDPYRRYTKFSAQLIDRRERLQRIPYLEFLQENRDTYRVGVSLLNKFIQKILWGKPYFMSYSKDWDRFYFRAIDKNFRVPIGAEDTDDHFDNEELNLMPDEIGLGYSRKVNPQSGISARSRGRAVVQYYEYGRDRFCRHLGFQFNYKLFDGSLYAIINSAYQFTSDGKKPLEDRKLIGKYATPIKSRTYSKGVRQEIDFIFRFLKERFPNRSHAELCSIQDSQLWIVPIKEFGVDFGIPEDQGPSARKTSKPLTEVPAQPTLFSL